MNIPWEHIAVAYLLILKVLTAIQDAVDAEPTGLKPPFGRLIYYMKSLSGQLGWGNRPQAIGGIDAKTITAINNAVADSNIKQS